MSLAGVLAGAEVKRFERKMGDLEKADEAFALGKKI